MSIGVSGVYVEDPQGSATHMSRWVMDVCRYFTPAARCAMGLTAVRYADGTETAVGYADWVAHYPYSQFDYVIFIWGN